MESPERRKSIIDLLADLENGKSRPTENAVYRHLRTSQLLLYRQSKEQTIYLALLMASVYEDMRMVSTMLRWSG